MIKTKYKVDYLKNEMKNYLFLKAMQRYYKDRLDLISHKLEGVRSISPKGVVYENCGNPYKEMKNEYLTEECKIIELKKPWDDRIDYVDRTLNKINDDKYKEMIKDLYIYGKNKSEVAQKYHLNRQWMYKKIYKILSRIV